MTPPRIPRSSFICAELRAGSREPHHGRAIIGPLAIPPLASPYGHFEDITYAKGEAWLLSRADAVREVYRFNRKAIADGAIDADSFDWAYLLEVETPDSWFVSFALEEGSGEASPRINYSVSMATTTADDLNAILGAKVSFTVDEVADLMGQFVKSSKRFTRREVERLLVALPDWLANDDQHSARNERAPQ